jgi:hypothetical protein
MNQRPELPSVEHVDALPSESLGAFIAQLAALQARAAARLALPATTGSATDEMLDVKKAACRLGMTVSYLRHEGDRLHAEMVTATGEGFIVPWGEGTVRYSAAGIEALKRWRRSQPRIRRCPGA